MLKAAGARRAWPIWAAVLPVSAWAAIRLLGLERGYPLVPLLAYTPYAAAAALLLAGLAVALRNWAAAALVGLATIGLAAAVVPRTIGHPADPTGHRQLRVLSANVHRGTADPRALAALVERFHADLLAVQELTPRFAAQLRAAGIARLLPAAHLVTQRDEPQVGGSGLYARRPLTALAEPERFRFRMPRAALRLEGGQRLRVVDVHPYPPRRSHLREWEAPLESLPATGSGAPWILVGDFNATLDHAELRDVLGRGYRDAAAQTGRGLEPTWPAYGSMPPVTIDHVLADRRLGVAEYRVLDLPGSDHRAVFASLVLP